MAAGLNISAALLNRPYASDDQKRLLFQNLPSTMRAHTAETHNADWDQLPPETKQTLFDEMLRRLAAEP
ncbi:hypothetical protein FRB97_008240, partial [Tulasnella sp. 331]